jgi:cellulose synthase (UDP-forming)
LDGYLIFENYSFELLANVVYLCYVLKCGMWVEIPQERRFLRFKHNLDCQLELANEIVNATTVDLSEGGALIQIPDTIQPSQLSETVKLSIPTITDRGFRVKIARKFRQEGKNYLGLEFIKLSSLQTRHLVNFIFCRPCRWQPIKTTEFQAAIAFLKTVFRFYPLAEARWRSHLK